VPEVIFEINRDLNVSMRDQVVPGHNRWHPEVPPAATLRTGSTYRIECKDWTDNQVRNDDSSDDIRDMNIDPCHMLSGPFSFEGVEPGDLLVVDIVNIGPFQEQAWGYTGVFAKENGGGFLTDYSPGASKAIWDLDGVWASSRHVPGVRFIGNSHPGLFGCAPSPDLLAEWNRREQALIDQNPDRVTGDQPANDGNVPGTPQVPGLALPPLAKDALLGTLSGSAFDRAAAEAVRTIPFMGRQELFRHAECRRSSGPESEAAVASAAAASVAQLSGATPGQEPLPSCSCRGSQGLRLEGVPAVGHRR